jgi:hypothetical protein
VQPDAKSAVRRDGTVAGQDAVELMVQAGFRGNLMKQVRWSWRKFEPVEGQFDINSLRAEMNRVSDNGKFRIEFHFYAAVWNYDEFNPDGTPIPPDRLQKAKEANESAPLWLGNYPVPKIFESKQLIFQITNLDIFHPDYHSRYKKALDQLKASGVLADNRIHAVYLHLASASRGEEGDGPKPGSSSRATFLDRLDKWAEVMGVNKQKLMLVSSRDDDLDESIARGMGQRGGFAENYLLNLNKANLGTRVNSNGYLELNESVPLIAEGRRSGEENEAYSLTPLLEDRFGAFESFKHRYREATLRLLQMQRTNYWLDNVQGFVEAPIAQMAALSLGKSAANSADAWVYLRQSNIPQGSNGINVATGALNPDGTAPIKNFERWLYQRDDATIKTEAVEPRGQGGKQLIRSELHPYDFVARRTKNAQGSNRIGFAIDDRFLSGNSPGIALKVTYLDNGANRWELQYTKQDGSTGRRTVVNQNSGEFKTITWIIADAKFAASGMNNDFFLVATSGDLTASFVRIVKLADPPIGGVSPPVATIVAPAASATFAVGQTFTLSGSANDAQDGALPAAALSWRVLLKNGAVNRVIIGPVAGNGLTFSAPAPESFTAASSSVLEIELTATDSSGQSAVVKRTLQPNKTVLALRSLPSGRRLDVNGVSFVTPQDVVAWENWQLPVNARDQNAGANGFRFSGWSDGGARSHIFDTPAPNAANVTLTANFSTGMFVPLLDIDNDQQLNANTDGVLLLRYLLGFRGASLVAGNAVASGAERASASDIQSYLASVLAAKRASDVTRLAFDLDGDSKVRASTDAAIVLRYLAGLRGVSLVNGLCAATCDPDAITSALEGMR